MVQPSARVLQLGDHTARAEKADARLRLHRAYLAPNPSQQCTLSPLHPFQDAGSSQIHCVLIGYSCSGERPTLFGENVVEKLVASDAPTIDLSVVIPWCNRDQLRETWKANQASFARLRTQVIIVNCGGDPSRLRHLLGKDVPLWLQVLNVPAPGFNKSLAINLGVSLAASRTIMLLDSDIILQPLDLISKLLTRLKPETFVLIHKVREADSTSKPAIQIAEWGTDFWLRHTNGRSARLVTAAFWPQDGTRIARGLLTLHKDDFLSINGMNADLNQWGWEDIDLAVRLQLAADLKLEEYGEVLHLPHSHDQSPEERNASNSTNMASCLLNYSLGHLRGTYLEDVKEHMETVL